MRVLLCEDDALIANGIVAGLEMQNLVVDHVETAGAAWAMLETVTFDLMILDLGLPDEDGLQVLTRMRRAGHDLPLLILTARDSVPDRVAGLQAGGDDYMLKPFDLRELIARVHTLIRRSAGRAANRINHGALSFDPSSREAWLAGQPVELSRREQALLLVLLNNPGRVLSADQIKDAMYSFDDEVESNALNVHLHHLRRKLGNDIVETIRGAGYRLGSARTGNPQ